MPGYVDRNPYAPKKMARFDAGPAPMLLRGCTRPDSTPSFVINTHNSVDTLVTFQCDLAVGCRLLPCECFILIHEHGWCQSRFVATEQTPRRRQRPHGRSPPDQTAQTVRRRESPGRSTGTGSTQFRPHSRGTTAENDCQGEKYGRVRCVPSSGSGGTTSTPFDGHAVDAGCPPGRAEQTLARIGTSVVRGNLLAS